MFIFEVCLLLIGDSLIHGAPAEPRLVDLLNFNTNPSDPLPSASTGKAPDPTKRLNIPSIDEDGAKAVLGELGYNETVNGDEFGVSLRFGDGSDLSFEDMIRSYQEDLGLDVTGELDDETKLIMGSPRCGTRNLEKRVDVAKWPKRLISYRIQNYPGGVSSDFVNSMIKRAFNEWSKVTNLNFVESSAPEVDIHIGFGGTFHSKQGYLCKFDNSDVLGHAFFPYDGDVHFNKKFFFDSSDLGVDFFLTTAIHEIGHSLGLDHSNTRGALMYPTGDIMYTKPQPEDVLRIQQLYGPRTRRGGLAEEKPTASRLCTVTKYDAVLALGNTWYIFAGNYYYDTTESNPSGKLISSRWPALTGPIDAAFQYIDGRTYFFKGRLFWRYQGNRLEAGYPRGISDGLRATLPNSIDAAFVDASGKIFALKQKSCWIYDPSDDTTMVTSIRSLGLPDNVDAAVGTGTTVVVFKDNHFYRYTNENFKLFRNGWMTC